MEEGAHPVDPKDSTTAFAVFRIFLRLGLTSFGGPIAHIGYFREEFVVRRKWLDDHSYGDLVALCQFLPGPASSQVGMALGLSRAGLSGALAAWLGFTLPSAVALVLFGLWFSRFGDSIGGAWLHGLKIVAVAVVAQALWGMGRSLCPDKLRATAAVGAAAIVTLLSSSAFAQISVIAGGAMFGWLLLSPSGLLQSPAGISTGKTAGWVALSIFFLLLVLLPAAAAGDRYALRLFESFYRAGSLVFGGGHVVLPLLRSEVVPVGWVAEDAFLAGYGAAQAVPGPLFTFAAYLGSVSRESPAGWLGAAIALVAVFLPSFLLVVGALPFWERLRRQKSMQRSMLGINAAVVGLLLAAFYDPVWTSAVRSAPDFCLVAAAFLLLVFWKVPPWAVVVLTATAAGIGLAG